MRLSNPGKAALPPKHRTATRTGGELWGKTPSLSGVHQHGERKGKHQKHTSTYTHSKAGATKTVYHAEPKRESCFKIHITENPYVWCYCTSVSRVLRGVSCRARSSALPTMQWYAIWCYQPQVGDNAITVAGLGEAPSNALMTKPTLPKIAEEVVLTGGD